MLNPEKVNRYTNIIQHEYIYAFIAEAMKVVSDTS